jgi:hypothetical protein
VAHAVPVGQLAGLLRLVEQVGQRQDLAKVLLALGDLGGRVARRRVGGGGGGLGRGGVRGVRGLCVRVFLLCVRGEVDVKMLFFVMKRVFVIYQGACVQGRGL